MVPPRLVVSINVVKSTNILTSQTHWALGPEAINYYGSLSFVFAGRERQLLIRNSIRIRYLKKPGPPRQVLSNKDRSNT